MNNSKNHKEGQWLCLVGIFGRHLRMGLQDAAVVVVLAKVSKDQTERYTVMTVILKCGEDIRIN